MGIANGKWEFRSRGLLRSKRSLFLVLIISLGLGALITTCESTVGVPSFLYG